MWQKHNIQLANFDVASLRVIWFRWATALPTAFGSPSQSRPNGSASAIKSKPPRSLRSQLVKYGFFDDKVERFRLKSGSLPPTDSSSYNV
jgi:hypothetical protein